MQRTRVFGTTMVLVALASSGCMGQLGTEGDAPHVDALTGSLGNVDVTGTPELREVSLRDNELYIELRHADGFGHFGMVGITIPRDRAPVGSAVLALIPENAELIGCSGPDDGDWEFDCTPDEYTVDITNKADRITVDFTGEFDCEGGGTDPAPDPTVDGSVDVDLI